MTVISFVMIVPLCATSSPRGDGAYYDITRTGTTALSQIGGARAAGWSPRERIYHSIDLLLTEFLLFTSWNSGADVLQSPKKFEGVQGPLVQQSVFN
jgi:hypothetical protein